MHRLKALLASVLAVAALGPGPGRADETALRDMIELPATAMWLDFGSPGLVLAVVRGEDTVVLGLGETSKGSGAPPNGRTLARIGSISKAFTGEVLARLETDGKVHLADPAQTYLPGTTLPQAGGRPITLIDLATHSAGLPRELPGGPPPNGSLVTWADYKAYLATAKLAYLPGHGAAYSNVGFGILGEALAGAAGKPFADLVRERITAPIGMNDTVFRLGDDQRRRLMIGHDFDGSAMPDTDVADVTFGAGGLYSTADDMVRFMRWHLDRNDPAGDRVRVLDHALFLQRDGLEVAAGFDEAGTMDAIGLAWIALMPSGPRPFLLGKSGALQGVMSYLVLAPTRGVGIFVVANKFNFGGYLQLAAAANALVAELAPR